MFTGLQTAVIDWTPRKSGFLWHLADLSANKSYFLPQCLPISTLTSQVPNVIPFNAPPVGGNELAHISASLLGGKLSGDATYGRKCEAWFCTALNVPKTLLTPSCTHSLEMAALLLDIAPGDEVIMPSYTFVSTANAFALRGATIVFVDIRPDTMNIDETLIEQAITPKTRAIVVVHYAGVGCEMDVISDIAARHGITVIEDAAQGICSSFQGRPLGTFGAVSAFSFHETKNITSGGEGGLTVINDPSLIERSEIIREKGTNRSRFFRGQVDKYSWVDIGSSYLMNEISAAYLWAQLEAIDAIQSRRMQIWDNYRAALQPLADAGRIELPFIPQHVQHNAHMFYIKCRDDADQVAFMSAMKAQGITCVSHYVPLHSSEAGRKLGRLHGDDRHTTRESHRLVRLPLFFGLTESQQDTVIKAVTQYLGAGLSTGPASTGTISRHSQDGKRMSTRGA
jgi:dTDP-4-amino-4,6-dideoxygalactose transaminase